jgi:hypothetical protein
MEDKRVTSVLVARRTGVLGHEAISHLLQQGYTARGTTNVEWGQLLTSEGLVSPIMALLSNSLCKLVRSIKERWIES